MNPLPRRRRGAQRGTFLLTRRVVPGHVRSGGSDGARVELWTRDGGGGGRIHQVVETVTGGNQGIICLQDQDRVCVMFQNSYLLDTIFFLVTDN